MRPLADNDEYYRRHDSLKLINKIHAKQLLVCGRLFKKILGYRLFLIFPMVLIASMLDGVGILLFMPLLQNADNQSKIDSSQLTFTKYLGSEFVDILHNNFTNWISDNSYITLLALIAFAFLIKGVIMFCALSYGVYLRGELLRILRESLFLSYGRMSYVYYAGRDVGYFTNLIGEQIQRTLACFSYFIAYIEQFIIALAYLGFAFIVAWRFGVMALGAAILIALMFRAVNSFVYLISKKNTEESTNLSSLLIQSLQAFKYLVSTDQMWKLSKIVDVSIKKLTSYERRSGIAAVLTQSLREPILVICIITIVVIQLIFIEHQIAPILISILFFYRAVNYTLGAQNNFQAMLVYFGSLEVIESEFQSLLKNQVASIEGKKIYFNESIRMEEVYFKYSESSRYAIKNLNFHIKARTSVALIGKSGAGKSTIIDLLTLMLSPSSGRIFFDGVSSDKIDLRFLRSQVGFVTQETVIFDDSIANNICMWEGDIKTDERLFDRVKIAARQAHIAEFIDSLPDAYHTKVGDRGVKFSGGQRQRLFIARELFRKPKLLILDEATSALDSESEISIQKSVDELKGLVTVIIIAHRLSTIRNVDCVYVLEDGEVVESGGYQELRDIRDSRLSSLIRMQAT